MRGRNEKNKQKNLKKILERLFIREKEYLPV